MKNQISAIMSEGDLEVVLLYENHELLADIISPNYYDLLGDPPSEVHFMSAAAFRSFIVRVEELFAEGTVAIDGMPLKLSLLSAVERFCQRRPEEALETGLSASSESLRKWVDAKPPFSFWCGDLDKQIELALSRRQMINFAANLHKHSLLRLGIFMKQLHDLCKKQGLQLCGADLVAVREPLIEEIESRLHYLASWLVELVGPYFEALNAVVARRYNLTRTNDVARMVIPQGVTSNALRDLYGSTLVFKNYDVNRIRRFIPSVPDILKTRY